MSNTEVLGQAQALLGVADLQAHLVRVRVRARVRVGVRVTVRVGVRVTVRVRDRARADLAPCAAQRGRVALL